MGLMGGGSRVTCGVALSCEVYGEGGRGGRRARSPESGGGGGGDDPLSSKKRCREGLFRPSPSCSSFPEQQQQQQLQQSDRRHPTWLFGNGAGALLAVRQVPRELGAALLLIQAALESSGQR